MTLKEKIENLKTLQAEIVAKHTDLEAKKTEFRDAFTDAFGIDTDKPLDISKFIEAFERATLGN
jgi:hypothetical protein